MTIQVALSHETTYTYDRHVELGPHVIRLRPAPHCRTPVSSFSLRVWPTKHFLNWQQDPHGNYLARLVFPDKADHLKIKVDLVASMTVINPFDFFLEPSAEQFPLAYDPTCSRDLKPFLEPQPAGPELENLIRSLDRAPQNTINFLVKLNQRLRDEISYVVRQEPGIQTPDETLALRRGSCRDTSWLLIQILRHLGLAARFVSGYLIQLKPDIQSPGGPSGPKNDDTDLHAWSEVYLPGAGWIGLDPTSGMVAGEGHLPLACAPEPVSAAPVSGSVADCQCRFQVRMSVTRLPEDPRVTKPYTDQQWSRIQSVGRQVDEQLKAAGVRLTMGGKPTFVTVDDAEGDEGSSAPPSQAPPSQTPPSRTATILSTTCRMSESVSTAPHLVGASIFRDYAPKAGFFDELFAERGVPRPHCQRLVDLIESIDPQDMSRRWELAAQLVHESGIALHSHVEPKDQPRPWQLDALPLVISSSEWKTVSAALRQRATLLDHVISDLYGRQQLLMQGLIPPELVFANPGFLRPMQGLVLPRQRFLQFYAADLARSPDGQWWVLADRTDAPSGIGYALENRIVMSRMVPEVFQQCQVQRLAPYFLALQEALSRLASEHHENPRVVVLSKGPTSRSYFEDAYLARYLGYMLVEGGDLDVRNRRVMLKTLGGLLPVDVIIRRHTSKECDPLELDINSTTGVPGLLDACRSGAVSLANPLGSGVAESPALMAYLPRLCEALLGEPLLMQGAATWWCGEPSALKYVLDNLDDLEIKTAFRDRGSEPFASQQLRQLPKAELARRIKSDPIEFVAQEIVSRSTMPIWDEHGIRASHIALRAYLVAEETEYKVMDGALARVSSSLESLEMSILAGEGSKDAWVLADGPVQAVSLLDKPGYVVELRRSGNELPSRVADDVYWLGRVLERSEAAARLLRTTVLRLTSEADLDSLVELPVLIRALADQGQIEPGFAVEGMRDQLPTIDRALPASVFDETQPNSLRSILNELFRIGSMVRDRLSIDGWRIIHRIDQEFKPPDYDASNLSDLLAMIGEVVIDLAAFSGIIMESMTRTQAFRFLNLGRRLERALQIVKLVKSCLVPLPELQGPVFEAVLEVADSLMTYRSRYLGNLQLAPVLDMLLTDETNPRSVAYQLASLAEHVGQLPREHTQPSFSEEQRIAMTLLHSVRMMDIQVVADIHSRGQYDALDQVLETWLDQLPLLSNAITHRYLVHTLPAKQLSDMRPD